MNILALDMATKTGYAAMDGGKLYSGSWTNPLRYSDSHGAFMAAFGGWLADMRRWHNPQVVAWEMTGRHFTQTQDAVAWGLITRVQEWAWRNNMVQTYVYPNTLKKFATGSGRCGKNQMVEAMRVRWKLPELKDEDESDALAVLAWAIDQKIGGNA